MEGIYHFIGIGGIGMSGLARIILERNGKVFGSDKKLSSITKELESLGATIYSSHDPLNIPSDAKVIYSTDIQSNNKELLFAKNQGLEVFHRSELLAHLMQGYQPLLVAGTHGKTTTSSLLSHVLIDMGWDPSFAIGGLLKGKNNSGLGKGRFFIAEADESDGSFLAYPSFGGIITNIDLDHLDYWKSEEALLKGFDLFSRKINQKEYLFWCRDDDRLRYLGIEGISYGFHPDSEVQIFDFFQKGESSVFSLRIHGIVHEAIKIPLMGRHNACNAAAVFALTLSLGASSEMIRKAFHSFLGVSRRSDRIGEVRGIEIYDDYGHHPTEIRATIAAFKQKDLSKRLVCVFQPHRFTRTRDALEEFSTAFDLADVVVLTDIYSAGEPSIEGINGELIFNRVAQHKKEKIYYVETSQLVHFLPEILREQDVVLTMGAGDITSIGPKLLRCL